MAFLTFLEKTKKKKYVYGFCLFCLTVSTILEPKYPNASAKKKKF